MTNDNGDTYIAAQNPNGDVNIGAFGPNANGDVHIHKHADKRDDRGVDPAPGTGKHRRK